MPITLKELAAEVGAEIVGDPDLTVDSVNTLDDARPGQLSFLSNPRYARQLQTTKASAVLVAPVVKSDHVTLLKTRDPYFAFTKAVIRLHGFRAHPFAGIHPQAHVDPTASVGANTVIYPGVYVGPRAKIGADCILYPNVVIYDDCVLGDRVTLHANCTIGQDGYGYATHKNADGVPIHNKIPQIGNVIIQDDVEIHSNTAIARAAIGSTIIARGTKMGDLVAIGHGVEIGEHCLIVAQVGIAGSTTVGHHVTMAGQVGVTGHLKIADNVVIGAQSGVMTSITDPGIVIGAPAMPAQQARRVYAVFTQLPELLERVKQLEERLGEAKPGERPDGLPDQTSDT